MIFLILCYLKLYEYGIFILLAYNILYNISSIINVSVPHMLLLPMQQVEEIQAEIV